MEFLKHYVIGLCVIVVLIVSACDIAESFGFVDDLQQVGVGSAQAD